MATSHIDESYPARRRARRSRMLRIILGITAAMHLPVVVAVAEAARRLGVPAPWLVGVAWAVVGVALFVGRATASMADHRRSALTVRFVDIPYFIHWCAALWTLVPSVLAALVVPLVELARGVPARLPAGFIMWTYAAGLVIAGYGILVRRRWFRTVEREVRVPGLDPALDGFRIAQLSDLHVGTFTPRSWAMAWVRAANARSPDVAVVTGDMVTSGNEFHEDIAEAVGALRARLGVFACMGNHDYFGDGEPLVSLLQAREVKVLRNAGQVLEGRAGGKLWLAAIDDNWTQRDDLALALRDRPQGLPAVLLAHDPARFDQAADAGVELVLSGHTHGGQVAVPFLYRWLSLARIAHGYNVGFYRRGPATLFVHPGLGTTGPPLRIGVPPEVTILVLRAA